MKIEDALSVFGFEGGEITRERIKEKYRELAKKYHPDLNPNGLEMIKLVNNAYELLIKSDIHVIRNTKPTSSIYMDAYEDILNRLKTMKIKIEICGSWIWVTGDTWTYKETLKEMMFCFSSSKKAWFYAPGSNGKKIRKRAYCKNLNVVRQRFGSIKIEGQPLTQLSCP